MIPMQYALTFFEGLITFVSPCLLHMLPIYVVYFAGGGAVRSTGKIAGRAFGFILGFTLVFVVLGAFAGLVGGFLSRYQIVVNIVAGLIMVLFGLNYIGVFNIKFLSHARVGVEVSKPVTGFFSAILFGFVFALVWMPCIGVFLGSALLKATHQASALEGAVLLFFYSLGLGLPFFVFTLLIDKLKSTMDLIKRHHKIINLISGLFLIVIGILMMTGVLNSLFGTFPLFGETNAGCDCC